MRRPAREQGRNIQLAFYALAYTRLSIIDMKIIVLMKQVANKGRGFAYRGRREMDKRG